MDTQKTVTDLLATGLTQQALAKLADCSQSLISALSTGKRGQRPSKSIGDRLEALHRKRCRKRSAA